MSTLQYYAYPGMGEYARENLGYNQVVRVGDRLEASGQVTGGWIPSGDSIDFPKDLKEEVEQAFRNVDTALKHAGGKGWSQVFRVNSYHTDLTPELTSYMSDAYRRWMPDHKPIWTQIGVARLGAPNMNVEIEVSARPSLDHHVASIHAASEYCRILNADAVATDREPLTAVPKMPRTRNNARRRDDRPRNDDRNSNGDRNRPRGPSPPRYPPPAQYDRGRNETDSWRPGDRGPGGQNSRPYPDNGPRSSTDSYRPRPPQGDFTFRFDKPAGVGDSSQGQYNHSNNRDGHRDGHRRGGNRGGRGYQRKPRWQPSERALISGITANLPSHSLNTGEEPARYRAVDDLSDDDEQDMEISSRSSQSDAEQDTEEPSKKRARTAATTESAEAAPKWSNPDPYTALPCPDETTRKKKDVVKLIRKARLEDNTDKLAAPPEAENFISFDTTDDEADEEAEAEAEEEPYSPGEDAAPRVDHYSPPPPPPPPTTLQPPLPPGPPPDAALPSGARDTSGPLGSRKRTVDDDIKPPNYGQLKKSKKKMEPIKGMLVPNWAVKPDEMRCPWATTDHSATLDMAVRLHKEIVDFYDFVRPREFERQIRNNLVENLKKAMKRDHRNFGNAHVHPFGSYMSGLYLPTADMDLVVCSDNYMRGGASTYLNARSWLYKFRAFLVYQGIANGDDIEVISKARIPLVKYVDKLTGLRVDVSFENLGGVQAIETFQRWKDRYPAMPVLVTVIKHFLLMRGLNEPVNGGIGGFSVICLVVSMLQLMPQVQSKSMIPEHHLGELLLEFFNLYGRKFNHEVNAISLVSPIGYVRKVSFPSPLGRTSLTHWLQHEVTGFAYRNKDRLSIIDPNNPANDISGGSSATDSILARFHDAYNALVDQMKVVAADPHRGGILDCIFAGDYSSFRDQRNYLRRVHEQVLGPCSD
ncbi:hypothetical protein S40293_07080 [Stachybotrys chartarum IBT 40293]|nr:hypothetical protein S40293_07080 [Stachybotrys chartarum IBT 40293]